MFLNHLPYEFWLYHSIKVMLPNIPKWCPKSPAFFHCLPGGLTSHFCHILSSDFYAVPSSWLLFFHVQAFPKLLPSIHFPLKYFSFSNFLCIQDLSYTLWIIQTYTSNQQHPLEPDNSICFCSSGMSTSPHYLIITLNQLTCEWPNSSSLPHEPLSPVPNRECQDNPPSFVYFGR